MMNIAIARPANIYGVQGDFTDESVMSYQH